MQMMQNSTLLLLHKDPKSKTPARDVDCPPCLCDQHPTRAPSHDTQAARSHRRVMAGLSLPHQQRCQENAV